VTLDNPTLQPSIDVPQLESLLHEIELHSDVLFTWDYERSRPALSKLYEKAKTSQWNASTDLDWSTDVDWDSPAAGHGVVNARFDLLRDAEDSPLRSWGPDQWNDFHREMLSYFLSQFLHGEQGALACSALLTACVPWIDAKYYAATQVMDEARHVEVFARYIEEKAGTTYPINRNLGGLLDDIISDGRWDMTYLGMQIMVEGLALASFGFLQMMTEEPLLKQLLRYVMSDEARHVAFGVLSLQELYDGMSSSEIRERQEFAFEAAVKLQKRFMGTEVFDRLGANSTEVFDYLRANDDPGNAVFQQMLFSKIVPNCKKLGLLDAGDGWLRERFEEIQIIQFEDWADAASDFEQLEIQRP
jgi:hypothetical protein